MISRTYSKIHTADCVADRMLSSGRDNRGVTFYHQAICLEGTTCVDNTSPCTTKLNLYH